MTLEFVGISAGFDQSDVFSWFFMLRYGSFFLISIIVIANYLLNSVVYEHGFWNVTDLLVVFLLFGMIGIKPLGLSFPATFSFEIGIIYFANKLSLPLVSEALAKARVHA